MNVIPDIHISKLYYIAYFHLSDGERDSGARKRTPHSGCKWQKFMTKIDVIYYVIESFMFYCTKFKAWIKCESTQVFFYSLSFILSWSNMKENVHIYMGQRKKGIFKYIQAKSVIQLSFSPLVRQNIFSVLLAKIQNLQKTPTKTSFSVIVYYIFGVMFRHLE